MAALIHHLPLFKLNLTRSSSSRPPYAYSRPASQNLSYWDSIYSDINTHLKKSIQIREPLTVFEPMHHLTFAPPIAAASALCIAACEVVGGHREDAIVAASAIHLMHATIYTHDHLLLTGREPEPGSEIPHRFGPNVELLTGDGIMPFGFELLAGSARGENSEKMLKVIIEISRAVGAQGMGYGGGEDNEVEDSDNLGGQPSRQLHGCGAACGAILGGGSVEEIERLKRYGVYVGKVQGLLGEKGKDEGGKRELVEKWRALALKELEYFDSKKIGKISSFVEV